MGCSKDDSGGGGGVGKFGRAGGKAERMVRIGGLVGTRIGSGMGRRCW